MDKIIKSMAYDSAVRIYAISSTKLVEEARKRHDLHPTSAAALGRTLSATLLMASMYAEDQTVSVVVDGGGPVGKINAMASANGYVNGYIENPHVYINRADGHLDVAKAVGTNGFIHVTKDLKLKEKYTSSSPIVSGELAEDFTYYYAMSEQIPTSMALSVLVHQEGHIAHSGGFILQVLPFCSDDVIDMIEEKITNMKPVHEVLASGGTIEDIISYLANDSQNITEIMNISFYCPCDKSHYLSRLYALTDEDLLDLSNDETTTITCPRCSNKYTYTSEEIKEIIKNRRQK